MDTISWRIKKIRESRKYNQTEFAKILGLTKQTVSNYETGTRQPGLDIVMNIANIFSISTDYILGKSEHEIIEDANLYTDRVKIYISPSIANHVNMLNAYANGDIDYNIFEKMLKDLPDEIQKEVDETVFTHPLVYKYVIDSWLKQSLDKLLNDIDYKIVSNKISDILFNKATNSMNSFIKKCPKNLHEKSRIKLEIKGDVKECE